MYRTILALLSWFLHSACLPALNVPTCFATQKHFALCRQAAFAPKTCHPELVSGYILHGVWILASANKCKKCKNKLSCILICVKMSLRLICVSRCEVPVSACPPRRWRGLGARRAGHGTLRCRRFKSLREWVAEQLPLPQICQAEKRFRTWFIPKGEWWMCVR